MLVQESSSHLTARQAAELLGVSRGLIEWWSKEGKCPFLDEPFLVFRDPHSRKGVFYDAAQIERIRAARAAIQQTKGKTNGYLSYPEVRKHLRWKQKQLQQLLYDWHERGCSYLNGAKLDAHLEMRPVDRGNRLREVWVYNHLQLQQIHEAHQKEQSGVYEDEHGTTWLSAKAAHEVHAIWDASLRDWEKRNCPFLGRPIRCLPIRRPGGRGPHIKRMMYLESDLQAIAAAQRERKPEPVYTDSEGRWLFAAGVAARTGWPQDGLWYYRNKEWPALAGRLDPRIRAKQVPADKHPGMVFVSPDLQELWVYHEEDVERVAGLKADSPATEIPSFEARPEIPFAEDGNETAPAKRKRGRPKGSIDPVAQRRNARMLADWDSGKYDSAAELGRAYRVDRTHAYKILTANGRHVEKNPFFDPLSSPTSKIRRENSSGNPPFHVEFNSVFRTELFSTLAWPSLGCDSTLRGLLYVCCFGF